MAEKSDAATELEDALKPQRLKAKVAAAIKAIQAAYDLGRASLEEHGEDLYRRRKTKIPKFVVPKFAAPKGYARNFVERARQFAAVFNQTMVDQLGRWCRKHRFPLGVTLIYLVLPLDDGDKCMRLLRRAIRGHWTQRRVAAEVHARTGAATRRGRPRAMPKSSTEARQEIVSRVTPVIGWLEEVNDANRAIFRGLYNQVDQTIAALNALVTAAS